MRKGAVAVALFVALGVLQPARPAAAATPTKEVTSYGYLTMPDGVQLKYTVVRPASKGRFPVALIYGPYYQGTDPKKWSAQTNRLLARGFAVVGASIRGTGCSNGDFDLFTQQQAEDGAAIVEWAARQPWANGHVGMFGESAPGVIQYGVAGLRPPHLDAIAPFHTAVDFYRDVVFPGGMFNVQFIALYAGVLQPVYGNQSVPKALLQQGDLRCPVRKAQADPYGQMLDLAPAVLLHPFDGKAFRDRSPEPYLPKIQVPVLGCTAWQDDIFGSRSFYTYDLLRPEKTWAIFTNGYHDICDAKVTSKYLVAFLEHFVKGVDNGFERTPHVVVQHDARATTLESLGTPTALRDPSHVAWTATMPSWPVTVHPTSLYLRDGGELAKGSSTGHEPGSSYLAVPPSSGKENGYFGQLNTLWKLPDVPGAHLTYSTPRVTKDAEFFGPASADLWLRSTATDTDLQVTLSEVRPDGKEMYVQRGWLRASHRKLDPAKSTALRPFQTHLERDASPLVPGKATLVRVEIPPVDFVLRAGSSLRLTIDAPMSSGQWGTAPNPHVGLNTLLHDAAHPSRIVLGVLPGGRARMGLPKCDTLLNQPCRRNRTPVPAGRISLS
jgi:putative CocE/NonD family hydrolase